ncbi:MAG TPA: diheme cytochrome c-553 [Chitinophagaceae bacterium]|jgi:hypothetical protein
MRRRVFTIACAISGIAFCVAACNSGDSDKSTTVAAQTKAPSQEELIKTGDYIVTTGLCNDCHSPKLMTNMGPEVDSSKLLSGHPGTEPLPPMNTSSLTPGGWVSMAPDITAFVGPWGVSYAANLTPDSATGIGAWTEAQFISTMRTGKHLGNGRPILPPMPWDEIRKKTDDDLKAMFAYLKSLPAVNNRVPGPVTPPDAMKMGASK